jgi:hypothetical protein
VIDTLITAVRAGELDELFNQAAKTGSIGKGAQGCLIIRAGWRMIVIRILWRSLKPVVAVADDQVPLCCP